MQRRKRHYSQVATPIAGAVYCGVRIRRGTFWTTQLGWVNCRRCISRYYLRRARSARARTP